MPTIPQFGAKTYMHKEFLADPKNRAFEDRLNRFNRTMDESHPGDSLTLIYSTETNPGGEPYFAVDVIQGKVEAESAREGSYLDDPKTPPRSRFYVSRSQMIEYLQQKPQALKARIEEALQAIEWAKAFRS